MSENYIFIINSKENIYSKIFFFSKHNLGINNQELMLKSQNLGLLMLF